jgi:hypothetical protein
MIAAHAPLDHVNNLQWTALIESIVLGNSHIETLRAWSRPAPTSTFLMAAG